MELDFFFAVTLGELEIVISRLKLLAQTVKANGSSMCLLCLCMALAAGISWCIGVLKHQILVVGIAILLFYLLKKLGFARNRSPK